MIRFEKSRDEGIIEIKRPTEFSFRNYSIYNLEDFSFQLWKYRTFHLWKKRKKEEKKEKEKKRSEIQDACLLPSSSIPVQLFARISASFPLPLGRLIYFTKMCI